MSRKRYLLCFTILAMSVMPVVASATAMLTNVTNVSGGCVSGPTGPTTQAWDIEPGETYKVTLSNVLECANGGTDATLNVRLNNTDLGNTDLVATNVAVGVYEFNFTLPVDAVCTYPINYCTTPGVNSSGIKVIRNDGVNFQAHLRAASFGPGCTNPTEVLGPHCNTVAVEESSWGATKRLYH